MLLAVETVARSGSACVIANDGQELAYQDLAGGESERRLVSLLDELIRAHGRPDALAVAVGPGSFTGLRIGTTAVRTLAWLEQIPVHAVDSLAARAAEAGDGRWWVLMPLKKDTTFHGIFQVDHGVVTTLRATEACLDATPPAGLVDLLINAVAIGPALESKPDLAERWHPGIQRGSSAALTARGVVKLAAQTPAIRWEQVLPAYHQASAPEIQRANKKLLENSNR